MASSALTKRKEDTPARAERTEDSPAFVPRVDIYEDGANVVLVADMPGADESSVKVDLDGNELAISGRASLAPSEGYAMSYQEYSSGNYERTFTLADIIDRDGIKAVVRDGVLRLTLPKAKEAQPRRIQVKAG